MLPKINKEKILIKINLDEIIPLDIPLRKLRRKEEKFSLKKVYLERVKL